MPSSRVSENFLKVLVNPEEANIDIIAVHGLNPTNTELHAEAAWTSEGKLWLRDFLPSSLPNARVLLFGYNANIAFETSAAGVQEQAVNLLNHIASRRTDIKDRPIIFIAHSLGGIVVKSALVEAKLNDVYRPIREATYGIAFFGTPHQGGKLAKLGDIAATIVRDVLRNPSNLFMEALKKDSLFAESLQTAFQHQLEDYYVLSFYETRPTGKLGLVVDKRSATLGLPGHREKQILMDADHAGVCKFAYANDGNYEQVAFNLIELVNDAVKKLVNKPGYAKPRASRFEEADKECLRALRLTDPRLDKSRIEDTKDALLEGSCSWILEDQAFLDWWNDDACSILWIHGDPGKGKTMMMIALIQEVTERLTSRRGKGTLAYFFCQNTIQELNTTTGVLRGLIFMLICQEEILITHLRKRYDEAGESLLQGPNSIHALLDLLFEMLRDSSLLDVYLLIDALDECDQEIHRLLERIIRNNRSCPRVKWLMTSRNEPAFKEEFEQDDRLHTSLELNSRHVSRAVGIFIDWKVAELTKRKKYNSELNTFVKGVLIQKAEGTFLWVALVCEALQNIPPRKTKSVLGAFPPGLEPLYERMRLQLHAQNDEEDAELCVQILRFVTLAFRPLHLLELPVLARLPGDLQEDKEGVKDLIGRCGSFLTIRQDTVYFIHQSAKDFFSTGKGTCIFQDGQAQEHKKIASACFDLLSGTLRKDICDLRFASVLIEEIHGDTIDECLPLSSQYACLYWLDHLCLSCEDSFFQDDGPIHAFCQQHVLSWLEALSLIRRLPRAIRTIGKLEFALDVKNSPTLRALVHDIKRFILAFRSVIEHAPLQLYASALVFSPSQSEIRKLYSSHIPSWLQRLPEVEERWTLALQTLEGHTGPVRTVAFSPDGQLLVSGSLDKTGRVWDCSTGELCCTLEEQTRGVNTVAFSPDCRLLASSYTDGIVCLSDPRTGKLLRTLNRHGSTCSVAFSPNGQMLASGSGIRNICLWDLSTGKLIRTLEGHTRYVTSVVFSPDGWLLASASQDDTVRLWNTSTGQLRSTLQGHTKCVNAVVFSPNGQLLASASHDDTVRIWDLITGQLRSTLEGHHGGTNDVLFSPNGHLLASSSNDYSVRLWDTNTGRLRSSFEGHSGSISTVAFSPNGRLLASGSEDCSVRLWDSATTAALSIVQRDINTIKSVKFSPDGLLLACGFRNGTVQVWNSSTRQSRSTLEGHTASVEQVVFSPDGQLLASRSMDQTVRLWDSRTGQLHSVLERHTNIVNTIQFSPDGQLLASGSSDKTVRLWTCSSGQLHNTLQGHTGGINSVVFSPDGLMLASASDDRTVRVWTIVTGELRHTLEGHTFAVSTLVFSLDSRLLASGSSDKRIVLWDVDTGKAKMVLRSPTNTIYATAISSNAKLLASSFADATVRLWDLGSGNQIELIEADRVRDISFSEDGSYLKTNCGSIPILPVDQTPQDNTLLSSHWSLRGNWLTYNNRNLLWFPPEYRTADLHCDNELAVHGNLFAVALASKGMMFLETDPNFTFRELEPPESFRSSS